MLNGVLEWDLISDRQCEPQQHTEPQWQLDRDSHSHWHSLSHQQWDSDCQRDSEFQ